MLAIECQDIEGVELHLVIVLSRMQGVEIGDAVDAENDRFTVNDELLLLVLQRGLDDPGITAGPIIAVARDQAHALSVALQPDAVPVILDLVKPVRSGGYLRAARRNAKIKRLTHK